MGMLGIVVMVRIILVCLGLGLLGGCEEVPAACTQLEPELNFELGFARYELEGRSVEEWRTDLTRAVDDALRYDSSLGVNSPVLVGESSLDGILVYEYEIQSNGDQAPIPFLISVPRAAQEPGASHVVLIFHGHGETAAAVFDPNTEMNNIGGELLERGYVVVAVEMRSFGIFTINGQGHDEYVEGLASGEFVGRVVADNIQVAEALPGLLEGGGFDSLSVLGHSFGGYAALHVGALMDEVDRTMSSGHFSPYGCMNTDFHDPCQDVLMAEDRFEIYDTVGLISPRNVDLFYNTGDSFYTPAADEGFERLTSIYEKTGAPGNATFTITAGLGHEVPVDAVLERFPPVDEL